MCPRSSGAYYASFFHSFTNEAFGLLPTNERKEQERKGRRKEEEGKTKGKEEDRRRKGRRRKRKGEKNARKKN